MVGSQAQRKVVHYLKKSFERSERRAYELVEINRATMRYRRQREENKVLREQIMQISLKHKAFG